MAGSPESENEREVPSSRPLHNFTLPSQLKWGRQKHLRCSKSPHSSTTASNRGHQSKSPMSSGGGTTTEIEAVREKLMNELRVAVDDHLKVKFGKEEEKKVKPSEEEKKVKPSEEEQLPWNLRNRRAVSKATSGGTIGNASWSPMQQSEKGLSGPAVANINHGEASGSAQQERSKFSLTLSKEEIETDFLLMTGAKPPRRPKKRSRPVQKQLDGLFPGSWLTEVTPENYKVPDPHEPKGHAEK